LQELSNVLIKNSRKSDIVSRIGGEEFTIIVSNDRSEAAHSFAQKLIEAIDNHNFSVVNNVTVSAGISSYVKNDSPSSLFKRVDDAMYKAKKSGKNRVVKL